MYSLPRMFVLGAAVAASSAFVQAQWTGTVSGLNYTDEGNWAGGLVNGVFSNNLTVGQTVNLPDAATYSFSTGLTFTYADNFQLLFIRGTSVAPINLTLGGNIYVDVAGAGTSQAVIIGSSSRSANLDLGGVTRTFHVAGNTAPLLQMDTLAINGAISNGGLLKTGYGALSLNGANTYTGSTTITGGRLTLGTNTTHGSLASTSGIVVSGQNTQLVMDSNASVTDRVGNSVPVTLAGGLLHFNVTPASGRSETLGTVTLQAGRSALGVGRTSGTNTGQLTLSSLVRGDGYATLNLNSYSGVTGGIIKLTNDTNIIADLVGGSGADGTTTKSIVPWITMGTYHTNITDSTGYSSTGGLVTYDAVNQTFRALDSATEYRVDDIANSGALENNRLSASAALAADLTVNGLFFSSASTLTIGSGKTLTVASGAIAAGGSGVTISGGTLNFGSKTGIFSGRSTSTISSVIAGSGGFIAANVGNSLTLTGDNTYTGPTVVQGNLFTSGNERIANSSALRVDVNGSFGVGNGNTETLSALSGRGTVRLENTSARLIFGSGAGTAGAVTFGNGGSVSPGDESGPFQASQLLVGFTGKATNVIFESGSTFNIDIAGLTSFDSLAIVNGTAAINGGALTVSIVGSFVASEGDTFHILTTSAGGSGSFTTTTAGWTGSWQGNDYVLTYSAVPEPSTYAALLGAGVLATACFRRRRAG